MAKNALHAFEYLEKQEEAASARPVKLNRTHRDRALLRDYHLLMGIFKGIFE